MVGTSVEQTAEAGPSSPRSNVAPEILQVARSNTFSCEWSTLKDLMGQALARAPEVFEPSGGPSDSGIKTEEGGAGGSDGAPQQDPGSMEVDLTPSTFGGAVFPPFPPLSPSRRQREGSASSEGAGPSSAGGSAGKGTFPIKINGHPVSLGLGKNVFDDEWDEDIVIGGKMLPGRLEADKAEEEVARVSAILSDLDYPPFTLQRLAELLSAPRAQHKSLGKFLRAVEKALLVTTPWEEPSYVPQPPVVYASTALPPASLSSAEAPEDGVAAQWPIRRDSNSTLPISPRTPMFSPVPFLVADRDGAAGDSGSGPGQASDTGTGEASESESMGHIDEGLMSPLILGRSGAESSTNGRSPTPEPEDDVDMGPSASAPVDDSHEASNGSSSSTASATAASAAAPAAPTTGGSDPAHQPFLGRVDELDTGPVTQGGASAGSDARSEANGSPSQAEGQAARADQVGATGAGEGGNMPLHGMSERPVPISATTTIPAAGAAAAEGGERRIASMPRSRSGTISEGSGAAAAVPESPSASSSTLKDRFVSGGSMSEEASGTAESEDKK